MNLDLARCLTGNNHNFQQLQCFVHFSYQFNISCSTTCIKLVRGHIEIYKILAKLSSYTLTNSSKVSKIVLVCEWDKKSSYMQLCSITCYIDLPIQKPLFSIYIQNKLCTLSLEHSFLKGLIYPTFYLDWISFLKESKRHQKFLWRKVLFHFNKWIMLMIMGDAYYILNLDVEMELCHNI